MYIDDFRIWLLNKDPAYRIVEYRKVGFSGGCCPLEAYFSHEFPKVSITGSTFSDGTNRKNSPQWIKEFTKRVDRGEKEWNELTVEDCLKVLEEVVEEIYG